MNSTAPIFIEIAVIAAIIGGLIIALFVPAARARLRAARTVQAAAGATLAHDQEWDRSYEQLRDACDAVIVELDSRPATYDTFPAQTRELLYSAHERAGTLERKSPRR